MLGIQDMSHMQQFIYFQWPLKLQVQISCKRLVYHAKIVPGHEESTENHLNYKAFVIYIRFIQVPLGSDDGNGKVGISEPHMYLLRKVLALEKESNTRI